MSVYVAMALLGAATFAGFGYLAGLWLPGVILGCAISVVTAEVSFLVTRRRIDIPRSFRMLVLLSLLSGAWHLLEPGTPRLALFAYYIVSVLYAGNARLNEQQSNTPQ